MVELNSTLRGAAPIVLHWQRRQQLRHPLDTWQTWDLHIAKCVQARCPVTQWCQGSLLSRVQSTVPLHRLQQAANYRT